MSERSWKRTERRIAEALGGRRVPVTGRARGDAPDVAHPWLSIECKHMARLPARVVEALSQATAAARDGQVPVAVLHQAGRRHDHDLVVISLRDFMGIVGNTPEVENARQRGGARNAVGPGAAVAEARRGADRMHVLVGADV